MVGDGNEMLAREQKREEITNTTKKMLAAMCSAVYHFSGMSVLTASARCFATEQTPSPKERLNPTASSVATKHILRRALRELRGPDHS